MPSSQPVIAAIHDLAIQATTPITLIVCGSTACLLQGWIRDGRQTGDCDVLRARPEGSFDALLPLAEKLASKHGLAPDWLNTKASNRSWKMPVGCETRAIPAGKIGNITLMTLRRDDLIASKVMGQRPHDLEDLLAMAPTEAELNHAERNLDRVEAEDLDKTEFPKARAFIARLRAECTARRRKP